MAVTQYIGARYVQVFADPAEWSSAKEYEPLTVVLHEGNSFTSKQFVPVGIDINNEKYWAETGNYNAQVEQYRREVRSYDSDVQAYRNEVQSYKNETEAKIEELENPLVKISAAPINGSAVLLQYNDNNILFDCGTEESGPSLSSWLTDKNVSQLNAVVLTHMHYDHVDGFANIASFCDSNTDIYVQMTPTTINSEFQTYTSKLANVNAICSRNNLKRPVTPDNGSIVEYGKGKFTFFNTDRSYRTIYDNSIANGDYENPLIGGLNNYSIITICEVGNFTYIDTGDVEGEAQRLNAKDMRKCDVARNPHHFANLMGYFDWYVTLSPDYWLVTLSDYTRPYVYVSYLYRFALEGFANKIIYPYDGDAEITWKGAALNCKGNYVTYVNQPHDNRPMMFYASLPAQYYNANPFILHEMSIAEFFAATKNGPQKTVHLFSNSGFVATSKLYTELKTLFNVTNDTISIEIGKNVMRANLLYQNRRNNEIIFYTSYNDSDFGTNKNYDMVSNALGGVDAIFSTPISSGNSLYGQGIENFVIDKVLHANIVTAKLTSGALIPCVRVGAATENGRGTYRGTMLNSTATHIYSVQFNNLGNLTQCVQINIATGSSTEMQLDRLSVMG